MRERDRHVQRNYWQAPDLILTRAVSLVWGCLKLIISRASVFFTLATSASLAACSNEWPLNSSKKRCGNDKLETQIIRPYLSTWKLIFVERKCPLMKPFRWLSENSQVSLSFSSGVGAMSTALLLWQFRRVGSAPWLSSKEQTSTRFLDAASWRGVNCHRSMAFTQAPCCREKQHKEQTFVSSHQYLTL